MSESNLQPSQQIPISWVSVHHKPLHTSCFEVKKRFTSLDDELLSDFQNRNSLYHFEEYNINEEDDDVFMDSVESIVSQHQLTLAKKNAHGHLVRISSYPDYHSPTTTPINRHCSSTLTYVINHVISNRCTWQCYEIYTAFCYFVPHNFYKPENME